MGLPELDTWRVESLRLTVFFNEPVSASGQGWWRAVTGTEPETIQNRTQVGEYSESGPYLGGQLELKSVFNRLDWLLTYPVASLPNSPAPDPLPQLSRVWVDALSGWLSPIEHKLQRIALGATSFVSVADVPAGNEVISKFLPMLSIGAGDNIVDLLVQVNTPFKSEAVDSLILNCISRWAVMNRQVVTIGPSGMPTVAVDMAVRNEFDLNTAPEGGVLLSQANSGKILYELVESMKTVLTGGVKT